MKLFSTLVFFNISEWHLNRISPLKYLCCVSFSRRLSNAFRHSAHFWISTRGNGAVQFFLSDKCFKYTHQMASTNRAWTFLYRIRISWFEVKMTSPTHHKFFVRGQRERYLSLVGLELVRCINCRKVSPSCCSLAKTHCSSLPEYLIFAAGSLSFCTVSRGVNPQL